MEDNRCFQPGCMQNADYACLCSSPPVCTCKLHGLNHIVGHTDIINESSESLRDVDKWKDTTIPKTENEIILLSSQNSTIIEDFSHKLNEAERIQGKFKNIIVEEAEKSEVLENLKNSELENELENHCSAFESDPNSPETSIKQSYQDNVSNYQQKPSLFNLVNKYNQTNLLIYNTEIESQASIILKTSQPLGWGTCIAQLPNGKLFCFGNYPLSGITLLIDENYRVQELPSGTACWASSAIYFNNNIYCFGGFNGDYLILSSRFDLDRNQWNNLTPLPIVDGFFNSIIYNGSILISGYRNKNILQYSIDSNSLSTIPYDFSENKIKILIDTERLYLIECSGGIYESEILNNTTWKQIKNISTINFLPAQICCQYNKEEIYIGCKDNYNRFRCFKFNLNEKRLIKLC